VGSGVSQTPINIIIERMEKHLDKFISLLEFYLCEIVCRKQIRMFSQEILNLNIDHVLSFNYTDTYELVYGSNKKIEYDYIHGKAVINNIMANNNMVLGIDKTFFNNRKSLRFIAFYKFYQRIYKQTGCKYREWLDEIRKTKRIHNIYFFGHSLDVSDGDILRDLI